MNREIKFREWDGLRFFHVHIDSDDKIFQLSTGLCDKNRKEIYEGDILKDLKGNIFPVKFHSEDNETEISGYLFSSFGVEIIGNIFENPELLK